MGESDAKSLSSLASNSGVGVGAGRSRQSSENSVLMLSDVVHNSATETTNAAQAQPSNPPSWNPTDLDLEHSIQEDLWLLWGQLVNDWPNQYKKRTAFVKDLVRKGIPQHFRGIVWQYLTNGHNTQVRERYADYLRLPSPSEKIIKRDIARTYPEHEFFKDKEGPGQEGLFNVMKAYSVHDSEVGYCQGSAFLVGVLLLQMPEEDAFCVVVKLMEDYRLREMYKPTMAELGLCIYQLECMVQEQLPELNCHFQSQNYHTSMYASSWFLTLFTSCLPLHIACRVMDLFLSEGMEMIFRISIAMLIICKEELLKLDMEGLLKYFQKDMPSRCEIDPDYLVHLALQVKYDQKKMKKLSKEYLALKSKEQEEMVELRRLRTENRLLRQRLENLEIESAELADKLIQGQVSRAQEAEDNFVIKRELSVGRQREKDLQSELQTSYITIEELRNFNAQKCSLKSQEDGTIIDSLQEELIAVKIREAENNDEMKNLRERINELEDCNKRLKEVPPDHAVAQLQEELIAVKLREAEANLSMKELRQKIKELQQMWQEHLNQCHPNSDSSQPNSLETESRIPNSTSSALSSVTSSPLKMLGNSFKRNADTANELHRFRLELMSAKLREAEAVSEVKDLRQKVMELETQNQVSLNQIRRQAEDVHNMKQAQVQVSDKERELASKLQEERRKYLDVDSRMKELQMMNRIKDLEQTQLIAELRQKVSAVEVKKEELVTLTKLMNCGSEPQDAAELHNRMAELQSEMFRLQVQQRKLKKITNGERGEPIRGISVNDFTS